jgi:hypothetical protein
MDYRGFDSLRQSPAVLVKAQTDVLRERAVLREVPELPYGDTGLHLKPEISTGHQQPTRMGIDFEDSRSSATVPSRVGVTQLREFRINESKHQQPIRNQIVRSQQRPISCKAGVFI